MIDFMLPSVVLSFEFTAEIPSPKVKDGVTLLIRGQACCCVLCCHLVGVNDIED